VTGTLPGADVRGFYTALGVELPGWSHTEAPARCFADPEAHQHEDRSASCSVNLQSGAFNCHGCGAHGGAYDAALAKGLGPRDAIELMIAHGLTERRPRQTSRRHPSPSPTRRVERAGQNRPAPAPRTADQPSFAVGRDQVEAWARALGRNRKLLDRLLLERGWSEPVLRELRVGFDGERITVPIPSPDGTPQGVLRLRVEAWQRPKVLAVAGTRLGLIHGPNIDGRRLLVEGASDLLAASSAGLRAIGVPGTHAWRTEWAQQFAGLEVDVVMDSDRPGRQAAARIAGDLDAHGAHPRILDLAPDRDDGYDVSDWLKAGNHPSTLTAARWHTGRRHEALPQPHGHTRTIQPQATVPNPAARIAAPAPAGAAWSADGGRGFQCARF
jgi:hypothetical protein